MAVPIGAGMSLRDVKSNMETADPTLTINSFWDARQASHRWDFNSTYFTYPATSLREFQGYNHVVDTTPPSAPTNLIASSITNTTFTLSWTASTDNRGMDYYEIYKNGSFIAQVDYTILSYNVISQSAGTGATWTVKAFDASGNTTLSAGLYVTMGVDVWQTTMSKVGRSTGALACADLINWTRYITGGNGSISDGERIYDNSNGTAPLNGGGLKFSDGVNSFTVSSSGIVSLLNVCSGI